MLRPCLTFSLIFSLIFSVLPPRVARAEEPTIEQIEESRQLYQYGSAAYQKGDFLEAEQRFRQVYELIHSGSLLYDIALAVEKQRRWRAAADTYEAYVHDTPKVKDRKKLEQRIVALRLRATRQEELQQITTPVVKDQGEPAQNGNEVFHYADGEDRLLGLSPHPQTAREKAAAAATPATEAKPKSRWWIWAAVGAGVLVAVGVGVGVGIAASRHGETTSVPDFGPTTAALRF